MPNSGSPAALSIENERSEARSVGKISVWCLAIIALLEFIRRVVPIQIVQTGAGVFEGFAFLGLAGGGWKFLFHGSTVISMYLQGFARRLFQIAVAVAFPLLVSLYFVKDATSFSLQNAYTSIPWYGVAIIAYVSWAAAELLDDEHPFRGFLIASTVLFVIHFMSHLGYYWEHDNHTDASVAYLDKKTAKHAAETGRYLVWYLGYVTVSYIAMLARLTKLRSKQPMR